MPGEMEWCLRYWIDLRDEYNEGRSYDSVGALDCHYKDEVPRYFLPPGWKRTKAPLNRPASPESQHIQTIVKSTRPRWYIETEEEHDIRTNGGSNCVDIPRIEPWTDIDMEDVANAVLGVKDEYQLEDEAYYKAQAAEKAERLAEERDIARWRD